MERVTYHVNLNYELFLSGSNKKIKGASWFDHIFFFINEDPNAILKSSYKFSAEYLDYLETLSIYSRHVTDKGNSIPWWGSCTDLEKEKYFNSKIKMSELGIAEKWIPIPTVISPENVQEHLTYPIISREEWGVSGRGVKVLKSVDDLKKISKKSVYSNFVNKFKDFGITFNLKDNSHFIIENYIDEYGQFKGGEIRSVEDSIGQDNFLKVVEIKNKLVTFGAIDTIQIDTFTYDKGFHPFVEVNYRKTMGLMISSLHRLFTSSYISWAIIKINKDRCLTEIINILNKFNVKVILLSPVDRFLSVALLSDERINFYEKIKELEIFISEFKD